MAASVIDRFGTATTFSGPVVNATLPNRRNEIMERISRRSRHLRGGVGVNGVVDLTRQGRNDSLEQLCVRMGVIPIAVMPNQASLTGAIQSWAPRRPTPTETITVTGPTAPATFTTPDGAKAVAFAAGGTGQVLAATDSVDAAAKGRALIDILP